MWVFVKPLHYILVELAWHVVRTLHTMITNTVLTKQKKSGCNFAINPWTHFLAVLQKIFPVQKSTTIISVSLSTYLPIVTDTLKEK